jgi:hypothetical protein
MHRIHPLQYTSLEFLVLLLKGGRPCGGITSFRHLCSVSDWQPRPYIQTILEMAESLNEFRIVKKN